MIATAFVVTLSLIVATSCSTFTCSPLTMTQCEHYRFKNATYPTVFGQTETKATRIISRLLPLIPKADKECARAMRNFLCALYAPPCVPNIGVAMPPCRRVCQAAARCHELTADSSFAWREEWKCANFQSEGDLCIHYKDPKWTGNAPMIKRKIATPASLWNEKMRPVIKPRCYDITDMGSSKLFRGWVDVQGQGAANDYCRVIAASNRRKQFLACTLAGSNDDAILFVSKRGFDAGHRNSWFMRDMDGDGRDDYCRCVGRGVRSKIYCMKAGVHGFYGGPLQPGSSEYTFIVPTPGPCLDKTINPFIGIR